MESVTQPGNIAPGPRAPQLRANLEIKARCADLDAARAAAQRLGARLYGVDDQVDTYFATRSGRLKLRESTLSGAQLIPYQRPDAAAPRRSDYRVIPVEDGPGVRALLADLLGVHRVVRKRREIHLIENVRIHLDRVEGLGDFLELEAVFDGQPGGEAAQRARVDLLMHALAVKPEDLVPGSYEGLLGDRP